MARTTRRSPRRDCISSYEHRDIEMKEKKVELTAGLLVRHGVVMRVKRFDRTDTIARISSTTEALSHAGVLRAKDIFTSALSL